MKLNLRDLLWLFVVLGLALAVWLERRNSHRFSERAKQLAVEVEYLKSVAPPISFVDTPIGEAIFCLEDKHQTKINVDWKELKNAGIDYKKTKVTRNLINGNLRTGLEAICSDYGLAVVPTPNGLLITTKKAADQISN